MIESAENHLKIFRSFLAKKSPMPVLAASPSFLVHYLCFEWASFDVINNIATGQCPRGHIKAADYAKSYGLSKFSK